MAFLAREGLSLSKPPLAFCQLKGDLQELGWQEGRPKWWKFPQVHQLKVEMKVEVHQECLELLVSTYPDTSEIYNIKIMIPPKNDDVIYEQPIMA